MKNCHYLLGLIIVCSASYASAGVDIREGTYVNNNDSGSRCTVQVSAESRIFRKYSVTVTREAPASQVVLGDTVKSDPFSFDEMFNQASQNNGNFLIFTKKSQSTERKVFGRIYEENGAVLWRVTASTQSCIGWCSSHTASCLVRVN